MKLHQTVSIQEAQDPTSVKVTLDEIVKAGKVTNPYQTLVLAWMSEFFKNGLKNVDTGFDQPGALASHATSSDIIKSLKELSGSDQAELAQYLKDCIIAGESLLSCKSLSVCDWVQYVLRAQR